MAGLPPFISFSTSYPELNSAVLSHTGNERFVGKPEVIVGSNDTSRFPEITSRAVGAAGMGEVYRVRGARLAVKILPKHVSIVPIRT